MGRRLLGKLVESLHCRAGNVRPALPSSKLSITFVGFQPVVGLLTPPGRSDFGEMNLQSLRVLTLKARHVSGITEKTAVIHTPSQRTLSVSSVVGVVGIFWNNWVFPR